MTIWAGSPAPVRFVVRHSTSAIDANDVAWLRHSSKCRALTGSAGYRFAIRGTTSRIDTSRCDSRYASGRSTTPLTIENTAVEAPSVNASVAMTAPAYSGFAPDGADRVAEVEQNAVHGALDGAAPPEVVALDRSSARHVDRAIARACSA